MCEDNNRELIELLNGKFKREQTQCFVTSIPLPWAQGVVQVYHGTITHNTLFPYL